MLDIYALSRMLEQNPPNPTSKDRLVKSGDLPTPPCRAPLLGGDFLEQSLIFREYLPH